jgi:hypothetical protein
VSTCHKVGYASDDRKRFVSFSRVAYYFYSRAKEVRSTTAWGVIFPCAIPLRNSLSRRLNLTCQQTIVTFSFNLQGTTRYKGFGYKDLLPAYVGLFLSAVWYNITTITFALNQLEAGFLALLPSIPLSRYFRVSTTQSRYTCVV